MPPLLPTDSIAQTPEVVNPAPDNGSAPTHRTLLHPAAGGLILGLDWILFSSDLLTGGLALPVSMVGGFLVSSIGTALIQRNLAGDSRSKAALKGLAAGIAVGVPFPIAGTAVGGGILVLSGLDQVLRRKQRQAEAE